MQRFRTLHISELFSEYHHIRVLFITHGCKVGNQPRLLLLVLPLCLFHFVQMVPLVQQKCSVFLSKALYCFLVKFLFPLEVLKEIRTVPTILESGVWKRTMHGHEKTDLLFDGCFRNGIELVQWLYRTVYIFCADIEKGFLCLIADYD